MEQLVPREQMYRSLDTYSRQPREIQQSLEPPINAMPSQYQPTPFDYSFMLLAFAFLHSLLHRSKS